MKKINFFLKVIVGIIRNKYLVSILAFVIWISFFDTFSLIDRYANLNKLNSLKNELSYFENEIKLYEVRYRELFSGKKELEKFAREQYLMKKDNEKIFIIVFD